MSATTLEPGGRFGVAFAEALRKADTNLVEFARQIDGSYESLRKIYKGMTLPGKYVADLIIKNLKMNRDEAEKLMAQDRMEKKVGKKAMQSVFGRHPRSGDIDALIPHLSDEQLNGIVAQMKAIVLTNKAKARR